jgi:hypothetical protein
MVKSAMRAEKKMIVGSARNAKLSRGPSTTPPLKVLKRKSPPASEKLINFRRTPSTAEKNGCPMGVLRMNKAKNN